MKYIRNERLKITPADAVWVLLYIEGELGLLRVLSADRDIRERRKIRPRIFEKGSILPAGESEHASRRQRARYCSYVHCIGQSSGVGDGH